MGRDLVEWGERWETDEGFAAYVDIVVRDREEDAPRNPGRVPCTTLWRVDGRAYLGRIAIRHRLTPALRETGWHIGYDVRRAAGSRPPGHRPALVSCDDINLRSRKVVHSSCGVFEDQRGVRLRYWVPTSR